MKLPVVGIFCCLVLVFMDGNASAIDWELSGEIAGELRWFPGKPAFAVQEDRTLLPSLIVEPRLIIRPDSDLIARLSVVPYARWDLHDYFNVFDFREANLLLVGQNWDLVLGIDRRFWGVTESLHLVDIINQTDMADGPDSDLRLGQPMVNLNLIGLNGTLSLYALPGFVERNFAGTGARLQGPYPIDRNAKFASKRGDDHVDYALRYMHAVGPIDLGLSHFRGTNREPQFRPRIENPGFQIALTPYYEQIEQTGLDVQLTLGAWLWKLEAITRSGEKGRFTAAVGGFEYTWFGLRSSNVDVGLLLEYLYDGRDDSLLPPPFADDIFVGLRVNANDQASSGLRAGAIIDTRNGSTAFGLDAQRRIGTQWRLSLDTRLFFNVAREDSLSLIERDGSMKLRLEYFF